MSLPSNLRLEHVPEQKDPLLALQQAEEQFYLNPRRLSLIAQDHARDTLLTGEERMRYRAEMEAAAARLERFAPYFAAAYPETAANQGIIESPLVAVDKLQAYYQNHTEHGLTGQLLLKQDSELPISGSIKARGGIYNVLCLVEEILVHELGAEALVGFDYSQIIQPRFKEILSKYQIVVSSTGNLGLSIGIVSAKFGFKVYVYMSRDARAWKKKLLREVGAEVVEVEGDYGLAVTKGRSFAASHPQTYFIDDERSEELFWGYSVAALRLKDQLEKMHIVVDQDHPLFVYLPCGVGGGPGGITMGLELVFGPAAHCFFGEPTQVPCALLGFASGLHDQISTQDIGLDNHTLADGLAVSRLSPLVGDRCQNLIAGCYTVEDQRDMDMLKLLWEQEAIFMEPSSQVALLGPHLCQKTGAFELYLQKAGLTTCRDQITHIAWGTGGAMVPAGDRESFLACGKAGRALA